MTERLRAMIERLKLGMGHAWTGHRVPVIAISALVVVAIVATGVLLVVRPGSTAAASAAASATASPSPFASTSPTPLTSPTPTPDTSPTPLPSGWAYSDLDGLAAPVGSAHRLPMAIMVDDNAVARPQSGISSASIVYQAPADGGEDRYMFVFQEGSASDIGPVRSTRPYYVYWAAEYKALLGHFGGDAKSLDQVVPTYAANGRIFNMDDLRGGSCPYHRVDPGTAGTYTASQRESPHNAYTNSAALISCTGSLGYPATYRGMPVRTFRDDTPFAQRPSAQTVAIGYHTGTVGYKYDPITDDYLRIIDGTPETDPANSVPVYARTVVVMYQSLTNAPDSEPGYVRPDVHNVGSGDATVFMEGKAILAKWNKTSETVLTRFTDKSTGAEIPFVRGEIFLQSVPPGTSVTVS